jgi:hypothetical protein
MAIETHTPDYRLILDDSSDFAGTSFGTRATVAGKVVFNTAIAGYVEVASRDPMRRRRDASASTYCIDRNPPGPDPDSMSDQFQTDTGHIVVA